MSKAVDIKDDYFCGLIMILDSDYHPASGKNCGIGRFENSQSSLGRFVEVFVSRVYLRAVIMVFHRWPHT